MACPRLRAPLLAAILFLAGFAGGASAADFPEIKPSERELTRVPEFPNAPAVVLFRKGKLSVRMRPNMVDPYIFTVQVRRKILTEEGKKYGEVSLFHSKQIKLIGLEGRTVLPDGRKIPLPKDAIFKRTLSKRGKQFLTSFAFPRVEVGAILDYQYEVRTSSLHLLEPWSFQDFLPTLHSEVYYSVPSWLRARPVLLNPLEIEIKSHSDSSSLWAWGRNLPALPEEPYGPPVADLMSRFLLIPVEMLHIEPYGNDELFKTWASTCTLFAKSYEKALGQAGETGRKAREIAAAVPAGGKREKAGAVYRFVRDGIETAEDYGVGLPEGSTADAVLAARRGDYSEKAVLLQAMLDALDIPARLVWVSERDSGTIYLNIVTPWWFERAIVAAEIDGQRVFLDPSDRSLAFGRLAPGLEGMPALLFDRANPEPVTLPSSPFEENLRKATVELDLDAEGRLSGRGALRFTGHQAWKRLGWEAWKEWLAGEYADFDITDVQVTEEVEETRIEVTWAMAQREDEVLGDETTVHLSRPLGPAKQLFVSPAETRISPVFFDFASRDETEVTLRWPEGWAPETPPANEELVSEIGAFKTRLEVDAAGRRATFHRQLDGKERQYDKNLYTALQSFFGRAEKSDAQGLVLVKR